MTKKRTVHYGRYVHSKLSKTHALLNNAAVRGYVPLTRALTGANLKELLDKYKMVYVKPNAGSYGNGVIRVEWRPYEERPYKYQLGLHERRFPTFDGLLRSISIATRHRRYLVQQGIHLLTFKRVRFDIRVMVQRNQQGKWVTTGIIGRVADPRKIVTNVHNGGKLRSVEMLMGSYLSGAKLQEFVRELRSLGVKSAHALQERYPGLKEIGVDVAVDGKCRPWILEVNTAPDPYIFRWLKDKNIFKTVYTYWKMHQPRQKLKLKPVQKLVRKPGRKPIRKPIRRTI